MSRTVTILYDSRAEAEAARERLATDLNARATRILGKDTFAALDSLEIEKKQAFTLRQALRRGAYVVIAEVPSDTTPDRVMSILGLSASADGRQESAAAPPLRFGISAAAPPLRYGISKADDAHEPVHRGEADVSSDETTEQPSPSSLRRSRDGAAAITSNSQVTASAVKPRESSTPVAKSSVYAVFSEAEAEAAGLFKERTIDFAEMREEAIVTKEAIVREEVIVTKTIKERTETVRDTVRHTEFEIDPLEPRR